MKLWQKVSLICSAVLIGVVAACSVLLLLHAKNSILAYAYSQAEDKQKNLAASFAEMADYYADASASADTEDAFILYCFSRFSDESSVLMRDGAVLSSQVSVDPAAYLALAERGEQARFTGRAEGRELLIVGSSVEIRQREYAVYDVEDITGVYDSIAQMVWRFVLIGAAGVALGAAIIVVLVRRSMKPLRDLGAAAKRIAGGHYEERAAVGANDEVGELAEDFNGMAAAVKSHVDKLTETAERQRLFIGGVSHEFKTPLTAILIHTDLLQNACLTEEETSGSLAQIENACKWLERMSQKLLQLICLRRQIEIWPESAAALLETVREHTLALLTQRGIGLEVECAEETIDIDKDLMLSALVNLLDNASKASQPGQSVTLRAHGGALEVEDHGCGIPADEIVRITDPFYMVDRSRSKRTGGSGLGLALVKEIVAAHGAALAIDSAPGKTSVRILLPVTKR